MTWLRNPVLFVVCLLLLANLMFTGPAQQAVPHARRGSAKGAGGAATATASLSGAAAGGDGRREGDPAFGQLIYSSNCTACHGARGHGMPRQGANLRASKFVAEHTDAQLVDFLKQGRTPADPTSLMGMLMPPRGGNRTLDNAALADVIAFLREVQEEARQEAAAAAAAAAAESESAPQ